ncbi:hypothetical protein [Caldimonas tepidiphila]|uniref:hypothetical protein n=1 Tax=Caldimonas tepidiphila TaxID=2315841 RepID=UPI0014754835|nr:hypothetical protein [Caldimonas tepidiphila]
MDQLRRDAQRLRKQESLTHYQVLDRIAAKHGYRNWSLLSKHSAAPAAKAPGSTGERDHLPPLPPAQQHRDVTEDPRKRYYLHGDQLEDDASRYYCAECDVFFKANHFADHGPHTGERLLDQLERRQKRDWRLQMNLRRPDAAVNVLETEALAARAEYQALRPKFSVWLQEQRKRTRAGERRDDVGFMALELVTSRGLPTTPKSLKQLCYHYERRGFQRFATEALESAWAEFKQDLAARQA